MSVTQVSEWLVVFPGLEGGCRGFFGSQTLRGLKAEAVEVEYNGETYQPNHWEESRSRGIFVLHTPGVVALPRARCVMGGDANRYEFRVLAEGPAYVAGLTDKGWVLGTISCEIRFNVGGLYGPGMTIPSFPWDTPKPFLKATKVNWEQAKIVDLITNREWGFAPEMLARAIWAALQSWNSARQERAQASADAVSKAYVLKISFLLTL